MIFKALACNSRGREFQLQAVSQLAGWQVVHTYASVTKQYNLNLILCRDIL